MLTIKHPKGTSPQAQFIIVMDKEEVKRDKLPPRVPLTFEAMLTNSTSEIRKTKSQARITARPFGASSCNTIVYLKEIDLIPSSSHGGQYLTWTTIFWPPVSSASVRVAKVSNGALIGDYCCKNKKRPR